MNQAAGRQFVQQGKGGRIVNVGSIDSIHPSSVGLAAYDASKGGVLDAQQELRPRNGTARGLGQQGQ